MDTTGKPAPEPGVKLTAAQAARLEERVAEPSHVAILQTLLTQAKAGEVTDVVVAFRRKDDTDGVRASPMSVITLNHLWRLFDEQVVRAYREVRQRAQAARSPTAGVSPEGPKAKVAAAIPRNVRRAVQKAQRKAAKKAARAAAPKPTPGAPPPTTN